MSLNAQLYPGLVSIYGEGTQIGTSDIIPSATNFLFGIIDQTWASGGDIIVQPGQSVMFNKDDVICLLKADWTYTLIEQNKILIIETTVL